MHLRSLVRRLILLLFRRHAIGGAPGTCEKTRAEQCFKIDLIDQLVVVHHVHFCEMICKEFLIQGDLSLAESFEDLLFSPAELRFNLLLP